MVRGLQCKKGGQDSGRESKKVPALQAYVPINRGRIKKTWYMCACVCAESPRLCLTLCNPVDCIPPDSCVRGVPQVRILEGVRFPSQGLSPDPGVKPVSLLSPVCSYALVPPYNLAYIYSGLLLGHKKEWISAICSKMDTARDDHTR